MNSDGRSRRRLCTIGGVRRRIYASSSTVYTERGSAPHFGRPFETPMSSAAVKSTCCESVARSIGHSGPANVFCSLGSLV